MAHCPTLHTERLVLRPFEDSDLDAYAAIVMSTEVPGGPGIEIGWVVDPGQWGSGFATEDAECCPISPKRPTTSGASPESSGNVDSRADTGHEYPHLSGAGQVGRRPTWP